MIILNWNSQIINSSEFIKNWILSNLSKTKKEIWKELELDLEEPSKIAAARQLKLIIDDSSQHLASKVVEDKTSFEKRKLEKKILFFLEGKIVLFVKIK